MTHNGAISASAHRVPRSRVRRNLRLMSADGATFAVMVGAGEAYIAAFALAAGMSQVAAGLIASLPMLAGASLQLVSPWMVARLGSHRRWVVWCATVQSLSFVPLIAGALVGALPGWAIFAAAVIYWAAGLATGPAWNTWAGTLVPTKVRARYFALRMRLTHVGVLFGLVAGGLLLQGATAEAGNLEMFAAVFGVAALGRFISSRCLASQDEPVPMPDGHRRVPIGEAVRGWASTPGGRLLAYMLLVQVAVQLSGPYFTPYMLRQMELPFERYMLLLSASFIAKMVALPLIGRMTERMGASRMLWIGGIGIIPAAGLWLVSDSFWFLFGVQLVTGSLWAFYEMATLILTFETIPARERTSILTVFNVANAGAMAAGSLIGAATMLTLGADRETYHILFAASTIARLAIIPALLAIKLPRPKRTRPMVVRTIAVRPNAGSLDRPVLPSIDETTPAAIEGK